MFHIQIADNTNIKNQLIKNIESIVWDVLVQLNNQQIPKLSFFNCYAVNSDDYCDVNDSDGCNKTIQNKQNNVENRKNHENKSINFTTDMGRLQMVRLMTILAKTHRLLLADQVQTKRSLYYELKVEEVAEYFDNEIIVDRTICHAAKMLNCATWDLGFIATAKGLISGNVKLHFENGTVTDCTVAGGALIPPIKSTTTGSIIGIETTATGIVIVEKESIFHKLLADNIPEKLSIILITGKGYPDKATRILLKILADNLNVPICIFVDANPHGFEIMCSYKYGFNCLAWERHNLTCSNIKWLGIYPTEMIGMNLPKIPLTQNDEKKLQNLIGRTYLSDHEREELKIMWVGKTELEALNAVSPIFFTLRYMPTKITNYFNSINQQSL